MRAAAVVATCLLLALAFLPAYAGAAEEDEMRLPFLLADGTIRAAPPVVPVLLPEWGSTSACTGDVDIDLEGTRADRRARDEQTVPRGPAYPDVFALLRGLPGASHASGGQVVFTGTEVERARVARLLGAVRAGYARRVHVEIDVRRGSEVPLIALSGAAPLGSLLVADAREDRVYPAGLELDATSACAEMRCVRVGPRVVASAAPAGPIYVLRLAIHLSRVLRDVRFEATRLTLVAPSLAFTSLVVEVPAAPNRSETIRCGDLAITYRVTPLSTPPSPRGTRAFSVDAAVPFFAAGPLPEPGLVARDDEEDAIGLASTNESGTWTDGADARLRHHAVPPGLVLAEGPEDALEEEADRWRETWRVRRPPLRLVFASDSGARIDVPVAQPARLVFLDGRLDPVVRRRKPAIADAVAQAGPILGELFTGRTLTVSFGDDTRPRIAEAWAAPSPVRPRRVPVVVQRGGLRQQVEQPGSDWAPMVTRTRRLGRPEEVRSWRADR